MPIVLEPLEELRRKMRIARGEEMPEPSLISQPQTGRTYLAPTSMYEYLTGRRREESPEQARDRQHRAWKMLNTESRGQASGDGFSGEAPQVVTESERQAEVPGMSRQTFIERLKAAQAGEPAGPDRPDVMQSRAENRGLSNNTAGVIGNGLARRFRTAFDAADADDPGLVTQAEKNIDSVYGPFKRLSQRNVRAQEGRVPGYMPGLTTDEQQRVSDRLMRGARGGMIDETSPLNNRAGLYAAAAQRDQAKELQKQAEQEAMSKRFRALQATRTRDADGNLNAPVESATSTTRAGANGRGRITTIAEKIAGVEDDPSTPMDESVRYRAKWDGIDPKVLRDRRSSQVKENREKRQEQFVGSRMSRRLQQAAGPSDLEMFQQAMRQAMAFDAANEGRTQLASTLMSKFGDYRVQDLAGRQQKELTNPDQTDDTERDRKVSVALALLDPASSDDDKAMGRSILQQLFGNGEGAGLEVPSPKTVEEKKADDDRKDAEESITGALTPQQAADNAYAAIQNGTLTEDAGLAQVSEYGEQATALLSARLRRDKVQQETSRRWSEAGMPVKVQRPSGMQGRMY